MYLFKTKKTNHSVKELNALDRYDLSPDDEDIKEFLPLYESKYEDGRYSIFKEISYWRKFNALHSWFVTNVQIGVDDCGSYEVSQDHIDDLLLTLENTLAYRDPTDMMPVSGFFFGSTIVDEYYWQNMEDTYDKIYNISTTFDWEKERLFYMSSW
jgi:hypothetical protein